MKSSQEEETTTTKTTTTANLKMIQLWQRGRKEVQKRNANARDLHSRKYVACFSAAQIYCIVYSVNCHCAICFWFICDYLFISSVCLSVCLCFAINRQDKHSRRSSSSSSQSKTIIFIYNNNNNKHRWWWRTTSTIPTYELFLIVTA